MRNYRHRGKCARNVRQCGNCIHCVLMPTGGAHYCACLMSAERNKPLVYTGQDPDIVCQYSVCDLWEAFKAKETKS